VIFVIKKFYKRGTIIPPDTRTGPLFVKRAN